MIGALLKLMSQQRRRGAFDGGEQTGDDETDDLGLAPVLLNALGQPDLTTARCGSADAATLYILRRCLSEKNGYKLILKKPRRRKVFVAAHL